jgi:diguanylate cyclase (GGDEF)-like protein
MSFSIALAQYGKKTEDGWLPVISADVATSPFWLDAVCAARPGPTCRDSGTLQELDKRMKLMTDVSSPLSVKAAAPFEAAIRADTLALLIRQSFPAVYLNLIVAVILSWTLWGAVDPTAVYVWLALLAVTALIRLAMFMSYFRARPEGQRILDWERPYAATLILSASMWGLGALYLMHKGETVQQAIVLCFLVGMLGGSLVTYSAHRGMTICAMTSVMLPSTIWLYTQPGHMAFGMAIASTIFMISALRGTKVLSDAMQDRLLMSYQLQYSRDVAENMARIDELTGMFNRRAFIERGEQVIRLCERDMRPVSTLLIDIDFFKKINDTHGHSAGDLVLKEIGNLLDSQFRKSDVCGRLGGEEFAVLLANTDADAATALADKFRLTVEDSLIKWQAESLCVTVSIGVASESYDLESLLHRADMAMYKAKANGRNATVCQVTNTIIGAYD